MVCHKSQHRIGLVDNNIPFTFGHQIGKKLTRKYKSNLRHEETKALKVFGKGKVCEKKVLKETSWKPPGNPLETS